MAFGNFSDTFFQDRLKQRFATTNASQKAGISNDLKVWTGSNLSLTEVNAFQTVDIEKDLCNSDVCNTPRYNNAEILSGGGQFVSTTLVQKNPVGYNNGNIKTIAEFGIDNTFVQDGLLNFGGIESDVLDKVGPTINNFDKFPE